MGNDSQSPSSDTLRSRRRSLTKSLSAATSSYNTRFLSAFKPPVTPPAPPPIDLPGLPGIRSDSGVARVFRLDPRVPRQRARRGLFGHDSEEDDNREEGEEEAAARNTVGRGGDTLPKHASVFTGLPSTANSVYPSAAASSASSSSSSDVAAVEGGSESGGGGGRQTQRRHHHHGRRKSVTFESDLQRTLPPPQPPPPRSPQLQQPFFLPAPRTPRPPGILSEQEGARMERGMEVETVTTFKVRVPAAMNLPDDIHMYLPRRGKSARPDLPVEWAVLAVNSGGGGGDRVAGDGERGSDSV